jgi:glyoxylase-like metal-dependent hydrolase (beta-lactamase superfamily II)
MTIQRVIPGVYRIPLGFVNAYLIDQGELTVIDTGIPGSAPAILAAVQALGKEPKDIHHILLTHLHADHTGSAHAIQAASGAQIYMHPIDAALFEQGIAARPSQPAPGLVSHLLVSTMMRRRGQASIEASRVDCPLADGDVLSFAGNLMTIHAPGHAAGQVVFLWPKDGGLLIAADSCAKMFGLGYPPIFEDFEVGKQTLMKISALDFETAVFGHGSPIHGGADAQFRKKWGQ